MKRRTRVMATAIAAVAVMVAVFGATAQPAEAAFSTYLSGSWGPWIRSSSTTCSTTFKKIDSGRTAGGSIAELQLERAEHLHAAEGRAL